MRNQVFLRIAGVAWVLWSAVGTAVAVPRSALPAGLLPSEGAGAGDQTVPGTTPLSAERLLVHLKEALASGQIEKARGALGIVEKAPHATQQQETARLYLRGKIEAAKGQNDDARRDLTAAFTAFPQEENYALDLGLLCLRQKDYAKAIEVFEQGSRSPQASTFVWLGLSLAQLLGGRPAESVETCQKILKEDAGFSAARTLLAFGLYMDGKYDAAAKAAAAGLQDDRPFPFLYYMHAAAQLRLQSADHDGMLRDLAIAIRRIPACGLCYMSQSQVHEGMGALDQAIHDLEESLRQDPNLAEVWYRLASLNLNPAS